MKTKAVALLLTFFLGCWGVHWFYLGKSTKGAVYLCMGAIGLFFVFPLIITGLLSLIDFIILIFKSEDDFDEEYNYDYIHAKRVSTTTAAVLSTATTTVYSPPTTNSATTA